MKAKNTCKYFPNMGSSQRAKRNSYWKSIMADCVWMCQYRARIIHDRHRHFERD